MMPINLPEVQAEVAAVCERYEQALLKHDLATLDELFWCNPHTLRYGIGENLYGFEAIKAYRAHCAPIEPRTITRMLIVTYGHDFATANLEFSRAHEPQPGRQSQTWLRTDAGWRIVAAHVSHLNQSPL